MRSDKSQSQLCLQRGVPQGEMEGRKSETQSVDRDTKGLGTRVSVSGKSGVKLNWRHFWDKGLFEYKPP